MTDFDRSDTGPDRDLRPIPDGGLASTLPAWLKEKPAWTRSSPSSAVPPDSSPIDPRTLVHDQDLPFWLLAIAERNQHQSSLDIEPPIPDVLAATRPGEDQAATPPVPAWIANARAERSFTNPEDDVTLRQWIESRAELTERRSPLRDPVIMGLALVAILVVVIAVVLLIG